MFSEQWERMLHALEAAASWIFKDRLRRWGLWLVTIAKGVMVGLAIAGLCELIFSDAVKHALKSAQDTTQTAMEALQPWGLAKAFIKKFDQPISAATEPATFFWNCKQTYSLAKCISDVQKPRAVVAAERRIEARDKLWHDTNQKCLRGEVNPLNGSLLGSNTKDYLLLQCNMTATHAAGSSKADQQLVNSYAGSRGHAPNPYYIVLAVVFLPLLALISTVQDLFIGDTLQTIVTIVGLLVGAILSSIFLLGREADWKVVVFLFPLLTVAMASVFAWALQGIMHVAIFALCGLVSFVGLGTASGATAAVIHKSTEVLLEEIKRHVRLSPH